MSPLGAARFGFAGQLKDLEMSFYIVAGGGGGGRSRFHSGWGNFNGAGGGAGGYIEGTASLFEASTAYAITIGAGGSGQSSGNDTTMAYNGGTITADGGGRGGNGSGNHEGHGHGANGGSGGGGGTVFANVVPQDGGGYNGGQDTQPGLSVPTGLTGFGNDGGKGYRGAQGASTGRTGGAGSGGVYNQNSTGNGAGKTVTPLSLTVAKGGGGSAANRGHGGSAGNSNAGGSGFIYILHDPGLTVVTSGLTKTTGTYNDNAYVHITGGTGGTITFS